QLIINPLKKDLERATLEFIVAGTASDIGMVEGEAKEISEDEMLEAIAFAHKAIKVQVQAQVELSEMVGRIVKRESNHEPSNLELREKIYAATYGKAYEVAKSKSTKHERSTKFKEIIAEFITDDLDDDTLFLTKKYYHDVQYDAVRNLIFDEGIRLDGRDSRTVRPIWSEVDYLPAAHGSAVFTRGETQSLTSVTLGAKDDEQMIDGAFIYGYNKFLLHYNFPAFSVGEVRPNRG